MPTKTRKSNVEEPVLPVKRPSVKRSNKVLKLVGWGLLIILILAAIGALVLSYFNYQLEKNRLINNVGSVAADELPNGPQQPVTEVTDQDTIDQLLQKVGKHFLLPTDVAPTTVVVIKDVDSLIKVQPFFTGATNGDWVIVYPQKAIIYSEAKDVLINVGSIANAQVGAETSQTTSQLLTLEIRNGSKVESKAEELKAKLEATKQYQIGQQIISAVKTDYPQTILVNLQGKDLSALEKELGIKAVTELPVGEAKSEAAALIIIGNK